MTSRRDVLTYGMLTASTLLPIGTAAAKAAPAKPAADPFSAGTMSFADRERAFTALYDVDRAIANFDAAYYGAMPKPVHARYLQNLDFVNRNNSLYFRGALPDHKLWPEVDAARKSVAGLLGCTHDEIALCGGGTDALYTLIVSYNLIKPGDAVILADVDYDEMQFAMEHLEQMRGAKVVRFNLPEPHTEANILAAYEKILNDTPRAKLLLLTHLSNRSGLIPPVKAIVAMARQRGVDVILDSAQAVGQLDFTVADTGADFIGFSLHKWVAAPLGNGGIYIRKERLKDISPYFGNKIYPADDILARLPTGTADFAGRITIPAAIDLHRSFGAHKLAHLLALRNHWVDGVRDLPGLEITVPEEKGRYAATTSFRLPGMTGIDKTKQAQKLFLEKYGVQIVAKAGLASGPVLRVTPALFNTAKELDRLVAAIRAEHKLFA